MTGGDVYVVPASGGEPRDVTPGNEGFGERRPVALNRPHTVFPEFVDGDTGFASVDPASGGVEQLWRGPCAITRSGWSAGASVTRDGKMSAVIRDSYAEPPEVWAGPIGAWRQISDLN